MKFKRFLELKKNIFLQFSEINIQLLLKRGVHSNMPFMKRFLKGKLGHFLIEGDPRAVNPEKGS